MTRIGALITMLAVMSVPCAAQSSRTSSSVMREYVAADPSSTFVAVPDNLRVDQMYRPLL